MEFIEVIETLTPEETTERLRALGMRISPTIVRKGIEQGSFPFGTYIDSDKPRYFIYQKLLDQWIAERVIVKEAVA